MELKLSQISLFKSKKKDQTNVSNVPNWMETEDAWKGKEVNGS